MKKLDKCQKVPSDLEKNSLCNSLTKTSFQSIQLVCNILYISLGLVFRIPNFVNFHSVGIQGQFVKFSALSNMAETEKNLNSISKFLIKCSKCSMKLIRVEVHLIPQYKSFTSLIFRSSLTLSFGSHIQNFPIFST